jgi:signal transduction histidine kinase
MKKVAQAVLELLSSRLQEGNYTINLELSGELFVKGHEAQLGQIVMNLLTNALDAMPSGGTLSVSLKQVNSQCVLCVHDSGHGIPEELKERLFEPFFTTRGGKFRGLGLSLVRALTTAHGGSVTVESEAGKGSTFRVYLPIANRAETACVGLFR